MTLTNLHTARVISISQPVPEVIEELGVNSPEGLTGYITRVSNPSNQGNDDVKGLIKYCCKHGHWSILEHVYMTVEIYTTRDISAQICRHRSFTFQEFSQRYASTEAFTKPYETPELRMQHPKNRQKSLSFSDYEPSLDEVYAMDALYNEMSLKLEEMHDLYEDMLKFGVAKECARRILPMATPTKLYMTGNIRSWLFYIKARNSYDGKSQVEHQYVADSIEDLFKDYFPTVFAACFER